MGTAWNCCQKSRTGASTWYFATCHTALRRIPGNQKLPLDKLWEQYSRIVKEHGAICLFADGMFLADLMKSNRKMWRYNLIWDKVIPTGFLNANRMPLRRTEEIAVFYRKQPLYHPQKVPGKPNHSKGRAVGTGRANAFRTGTMGTTPWWTTAKTWAHGSIRHP